MTTTQRHELLAWLGDDHGLTGEQITQLLHTADEIHQQYPGEDAEDERQAALTTAYRMLVEDPNDVLDDLGAARTRHVLEGSRIRAGIKQAVLYAIENELVSEHEAARRVSVDRMTIRKWRGLR
jgi:hypothetical protein